MLREVVKILVAAANEDLFLDVRRLLSQAKEPFECDWARSLEAARAALEKQSHHVCLVDYQWGDRRGTELLPESRVPLILLTDDADRDLGERAVELGVTDYLIKGQFGPPLLERSIRYAIRQQCSTRRVEALSEYDQLTGLCNRSRFRDALERSIEWARYHDEAVAVIVLDIDRFQAINDALGHEAGDGLLKRIADCLRACATSASTVARLSGDEFSMLVAGPAAEGEALIVAQRVIDVLPTLVADTDERTRVSCCAGIAVYPSNGRQGEDLLRGAHIALHVAKRRGRGSCQVCDAGMVERSVERLSLEAKVRKAFVEEQFYLYYQPLVDLATRQVLAAEVLLRWRDAEQGMISPALFVPVLEETKLIIPLGEQILRAACRQKLRWQEEKVSPRRVACNISPVQFARDNFFETVSRVVEEVGIQPRELEIEITESVFIQDIDRCLKTLAKLKSFGVRIAIDDFGTGYSSLSYLRKFPIDVLKIDRSFVRDVGKDDDATAIVVAIISMAAALQLEVVAEGVETEEQRGFLLDQGCRLGQGFLFGNDLASPWSSCGRKTAAPPESFSSEPRA